jgi:sugar O-acyltransferase (sialic acid O-acetyltransferase NeuD family)
VNAAVLILGAGGHAKVLIDALMAQGRSIVGCTDLDPRKHGSMVNAVPIVGGDEYVAALERSTLLVNGVGSINVTDVRRSIFERFKAKGFTFATVVHPAATVSPHAVLEEGAQVMAGAVVQANAVIGANTIVNTGAVIDHDCRIAAHCHIAPGCTLSGTVSIGELSHVGTGAVIVQGVDLGERCLVAAGAVVTRSWGAGVKLLGVPARPDR